MTYHLFLNLRLWITENVLILHMMKHISKNLVLGQIVFNFLFTAGQVQDRLALYLFIYLFILLRIVFILISLILEWVFILAEQVWVHLVFQRVVEGNCCRLLLQMKKIYIWIWTSNTSNIPTTNRWRKKLTLFLIFNLFLSTNIKIYFNILYWICVN